MKKLTPYLKTLFYGLYFYLLFHIAYFLRFGRINNFVSYLDIFIVAVGGLSVYLLQHFSDKLKKGKRLLFAPFLLAIPFAYAGTLGGGLFGPLGILVFGAIPFVLLLPVGYVIIRRFIK